MEAVTVPLTFRCPLCRVEVGTGEEHACKDGEQSCRMRIVEASITTPGSRFPGRPKAKPRKPGHWS